MGNLGYSARNAASLTTRQIRLTLSSRSRTPSEEPSVTAYDAVSVLNANRLDENQNAQSEVVVMRVHHLEVTSH